MKPTVGQASAVPTRTLRTTIRTVPTRTLSPTDPVFLVATHYHHHHLFPLVNGYHCHSLPLSKLPLTQHLPSHTPTVSFMTTPSPITIIITSTSTHQLLSSSASPPGMSLHRQSLHCTFPPISITPRQSPSLMSPTITCSLALQYPQTPSLIIREK